MTDPTPTINALSQAYLEGQRDENEACAELAENFSWELPFFENERENEITDDIACEVGRQIAEAIRLRMKEGKEK